MREIKFRGKSEKDFTPLFNIKKGDWVYGGILWIDYTKIYIVRYLSRFEDPLLIKVDPETVGQFIGLKDKDNTEIYEGDVVVDVETEAKNRWGIVSADPDMWTEDIFIYGNKNAFCYKGFLELVVRERIVVVGNIFDNPEWLRED